MKKALFSTIIISLVLCFSLSPTNSLAGQASLAWDPPDVSTDVTGYKLTIMADVAEIMKFREHKEEVGRDDYCYDAIVDQLRSAFSGGHDVQLHIHSSYCGIVNRRASAGR